MSEREKQKERRRQLILDAAEALIREDASVSFSMPILAERAGLSPRTTYNLIGSKATVLYILLHRCIDKIVTNFPDPQEEQDLLKLVYAMGDYACDFYAADYDFFSPLIKFLFGVSDDTHRPAFMNKGHLYWLRIGQRLDDGGFFRGATRPEDFARLVNVFFAGTLDLWSHGDLDRHAFRAQIRLGISIGLASLGVGEWEERIAGQIVDARQRLDPLSVVGLPADTANL